MKKQTLLFIIFLLFTSSSFGDHTMTRNYCKNFDKDSQAQYYKNIYKGHQEFDISGGFGWDRTLGIIGALTTSYRYFIFDKISLGAILGGSRSPYGNSLKLGLSSRWYFYEMNRWALSLTQNLINTFFRNVYDKFSHSGLNWEGVTQFGAHYFLTPEVYLGLALNYQYGINDAQSSRRKYKALRSQLGMGLTF